MKRNDRQILANDVFLINEIINFGPKVKEDLRAPAHNRAISADEAGQRLDNFLFRVLKGVPKSYIYRIIRDGQLRVNGGRSRPATRLLAGDSVRIPPLRLGAPASSRPQSIGHRADIGVLYEDDDLLFVDKPSGLAVHSGSGHETGLIEHLRVERAGYLELAHRLDKDTSGVLVLAKSAGTLRALHELFRPGAEGKKLEKIYLALLQGRWRGGERVLQHQLETVRSNGAMKRSEISNRGREAVSVFRPIERFSDSTLMQVALRPGRLHQIRAHASAVGYPVAGDRLYGDKVKNLSLRKLGLRRQFLHALRLQFEHPRSGHSIMIEAPLPEELEKVLEKLRQTAVRSDG